MKTPQPWQAISRCSEQGLETVAVQLASELRAGDRVILEGPLGAGKSTFARALIKALGAEQPPEGSPTFAIAHEYRSRKADIAHIDLYRLKNEVEIEDSGIPSYFWERSIIVLVEWLSLHPSFQRSVLSIKDVNRNWLVTMRYVRNSAGKIEHEFRSLDISVDGETLNKRPV